MNLVLGIAIACLAFLLVEAALLRRAARGIPRRILVTGTRGKSSLVRALIAGIRTVEPAVWGKITGDVPAILRPDGTTRVLKRRGPAHLREQARFLSHCRRNDAGCVVVESMAISPEAMKAEMRLIRPTLVIITNVRDDHRETLGADPDRQRAAYLESLPERCRWLTRDEDLIAFAARSSHWPEHEPEPEPVSGNGAPDADKGRAGINTETSIVSETLATALAALDLLGWSTGPSRRALADAAAEVVKPPAMVTLGGREMILLDAFSANDAVSLDRLWSEWRRDSGDISGWSVLLNTRADRPLRTGQFCRWITGRRDIDEVYVAGSHSSAAARLLRRHGLRINRLPARGVSVSSTSGPAGSPTGSGLMGSGRVLVGIGNAGGLGLELRTAASAGGRVE